MKSENTFNKLIKISLILYILFILYAIVLKSIMPTDLIDNYKFLSTMDLSTRFIRGLKIIEFYEIEYSLGIIKKTIILDILNMIIFIPFGILITHYIKKYKVLNIILISLLISIIIELFQLFTLIGAFMLNDLIINVLGGLIGSIIYILVTNGKRYFIYNVLLIVFSIIISVVLVYLLFMFITNINVYIDIITKRI